MWLSSSPVIVRCSKYLHVFGRLKKIQHEFSLSDIQHTHSSMPTFRSSFLNITVPVVPSEKCVYLVITSVNFPYSVSCTYAQNFLILMIMHKVHMIHTCEAWWILSADYRMRFLSSKKVMVTLEAAQKVLPRKRKALRILTPGEGQKSGKMTNKVYSSSFTNFKFEIICSTIRAFANETQIILHSVNRLSHV